MLTLLKIGGVVIMLIGALHAVFGLGADRMLDPSIPDAAVRHASLDSQNRFYGTAFALYGVLLWICSTDIDRYGPVFVALLIVFFVGGSMRIVSALLHGMPSVMIRVLTALELVLPPVLLWWKATL
jgi:hypothetical protein